MNRIGLLAGNRRFPFLFAKLAKQKKPDLQIVTVAIKGETDRRISRLVDKVYWVRIGQLQAIIDIFLKERIENAVLVGQISPYRIFRDRSGWDSLMRKVACCISDFRPHSVFTEIINQAQEQGLNFLSSVTYMDDYLVSDGLNNRINPSQQLKEDIDRGIDLARQVVNLDIGQTVVFKDKAIVAVEALEGTDSTIRRAVRICGKGIWVIKLAKANQDLRFDVPIVGISTIKLLARAKAKALVLNKNKTLILDKPKVIYFADKVGIPIIGA